MPIFRITTLPQPALYAILCTILFGCGSSAPLAQITCHVSHQDQPVPGAEIHFELTGGKSATVSAVSRVDGSCYVDLGERKGMPPGDYLITVIRHETIDGTPLPEGEAGQALLATGQARRTRYEFRKQLVQGKNALTLQLEESTPLVEANPDDNP